MKFEYKLFYFRAGLATASGLPEELNDEFNRLGADGWEYVDMKPILTGGFFAIFAGVFTNTRSFVVVFRRTSE